MGEIYYNNMIVRNSENLIIFTAPTTTSTTTIAQPQSRVKVGDIINCGVVAYIIAETTFSQSVIIASLETDISPVISGVSQGFEFLPSSVSPPLIGSTVTGISYGQENTLSILRSYLNGEAKAAIAAYEYTDEYRTCTDWWLPTIGDLQVMWNNRDLIGWHTVPGYTYWSSSYSSAADKSIYALTINGTIQPNYMTNPLLVRPVRYDTLTVAAPTMVILMTAYPLGYAYEANGINVWYEGYWAYKANNVWHYPEEYWYSDNTDGSGNTYETVRFYWDNTTPQNGYRGALKTSDIEPSGVYNGLQYVDYTGPWATGQTTTTTTNIPLPRYNITIYSTNISSPVPCYWFVQYNHGYFYQHSGFESTSLSFSSIPTATGVYGSLIGTDYEGDFGNNASNVIYF